jgi:hypothetical protein
MPQLQRQVYLRAERTPVRKIKGCIIEIGRALESSVGQEAFAELCDCLFAFLRFPFHVGKGFHLRNDQLN